MEHQPIRRSTGVTLGLTALLAAALTGCGSTAATQQGVCIDQRTQQRVDDSRCHDDWSPGYHGGYGWYYVPVGHSYPRVGQRVSGGSITLPKAAVAKVGGAARSGGTVSKGISVSRGGFGGSHGGGSGHGG